LAHGTTASAIVYIGAFGGILEIKKVLLLIQRERRDMK